MKLSNVGENKHYEVAKKCVEDLALYLKPLSGGKGKSPLNSGVLVQQFRRAFKSPVILSTDFRHQWHNSLVFIIKFSTMFYSRF